MPIPKEPSIDYKDGVQKSFIESCRLRFGRLEQNKMAQLEKLKKITEM